MYCIYCHQPCGDRGFCDDTCYGEYCSELNALEQDVVREDTQKE